jgi:hypothetical protein
MGRLKRWWSQEERYLVDVFLFYTHSIALSGILHIDPSKRDATRGRSLVGVFCISSSTYGLCLTRGLVNYDTDWQRNQEVDIDFRTSRNIRQVVALMVAKHN